MSIKFIYALLHVLSAVIWVGGMFFAYTCLRPAAALLLEPPQRLTLWANTFARFFPFVWIAVITLPLTGFLLMFAVWGGFSGAPLYVHLMSALGTAMALIFLHVYFAPYQRLRRAVASQTWQEGGKQLQQIRKLIALNLILGLLVVMIASGGRYF